MARWLTVRNPARSGIPLLRVRWCEDFGCRLRGLTFRRSLEPGCGLLLVQSAASRSGAAIHMWAVFFPLAVIWLDGERRVIDTRLALPWRLYLPRRPARFVLEGPPALLDEIGIGDVLELEEDARA